MTAYAIAWRKFQKSPELESLADPTTIGADEKQRKYLENRLKSAFDAGWNAKTSTILDAVTNAIEHFQSKG